MSQDGNTARGGKNLTVNRKASHDYSILEKIEAGIELLGTEVKVIRNGEAGLAGAYAKVENGQLFLHQVSIPPYEFGNRFNHDTLRTRRLLLHRSEIRRLQAMQEQKGLTLVPLRLYLNGRGLVKVELAVGRGKNQEDQRETIRRREADREASRAIASHGR
ncbi:MAG: SsrA-binding protein SmpB [bacterium]